MPAPIAYDAPLHPTDRREPQDNRRVLCQRCKVERSTIVLQTAKFCRACFLYHFDAKMKMGMEQARVCAFIKRKEEEEELTDKHPDEKFSEPSHQDVSSSSKGRVALGFSGGPSSRAMLHMARKRLLPPPDYKVQKGKLHEIFSIDVIFVDDSAVVPNSYDRTAEARAIVEEEGGQEAGLNFVALKLEDAFENDEAAICKVGTRSSRHLSPETSMMEKRAALEGLFESLYPAITPKTTVANARSRIEDIHRILVMHLLRREAVRRGARCLLTGETATRRAVRTIEGISRGQGHKLTVQEGPAQWEGLFLLRPMAETVAKEIAYFLRVSSLASLGPHDVIASELLAEASPSGSGDKASIHRLTESLIYLLESNVPGTSNTVNRTSSKLIFSDEAASHGYNSNSLNAGEPFETVGPAVPLRFRRRQNSSTSAALSQSSERTNATQTSDVRGLGLGGIGAKLYSAAMNYPKVKGGSVCPLCEMPVQQGLHAWKRGLTVDKQHEIASVYSASNASDNDDPAGFIHLSDLLCYACSIVLETPDNTPIGTHIPLPSFVLDIARTRLQHRTTNADTSGEVVTDSTMPAKPLPGTRAPQARPKSPMLQRMNPEQMRQQLEGFVLDDAEPPSQVRGYNKKRTDW